MNDIPFTIVVIYRNNGYLPFTLKPVDEHSTPLYAMKIEGEYYVIGEKGNGVFLCDAPNKKTKG